MSDPKPLSPATRAAQALAPIDPTTRAIVPPIHASAIYERAPDGSYPDGRSYSRDENPTFEHAEALLADLEGGTDAIVFSSGMAAATAVVDSLPVGAHVVAPTIMYWSLRRWLEEIATAGRLTLDLVPTGDLDALHAAMRPGETHLVWIETPANPTCRITDIAAATEIAHRAGALVVADNTFATPILTRPLELGVDVVMHSATKSLNGHTDVVAGALVTRDARGERWQDIRRQRARRGAILGPFECWLLLRGMRTLVLRVERACANAMAVAEALSEQPEVLEVFYPGLPDFPGHALAAGQMHGGFGPIVSCRVRGGFDAARAVAGRTRVFRNATSLGGVESLIEHRAPVEGEGTPVPEDLLRLSIGIEAIEDLIADLSDALTPSS